MQRILSFDQTPPLSMPLRFFLSAPAFAIAAALLMFWHGADALTTRWSPTTLALTHLVTLGFLAMSMTGALIQILPVVAGIVLPRPALTAGAVHALLTAGTASLSAAFLLSQPALFKLALLFLVLAFVCLLSACAVGLWRAHVPNATATVIAIRLAVIALLGTVVLGAALGSAFAWPLALPLMLLTDLHVLWGLLGWVGLLVIGVAYQVVPMFQVTPVYPRRVLRWLACTLFLLLLLWSCAAVVFQQEPHWITAALSLMILTGFVVFAATTLYLLWRRKRPKADATTLFLRTAMVSLLGCAVLWMVRPYVDQSSSSLTLGMMFIVGFAYSTINGMLYKIIPFLVWYHAQSIVRADSKNVLSIQKILPDRVAARQFWVHLAALMLLVGATMWPALLARPAALALCLSAGWLEFNLYIALRSYRAYRLLAYVST